MADFTNEETLRRWSVRVGRAPSEIQRATHRIGERMLAVSRRHLNEQIYSIPEDVSPRTGKPKWKRTGKLRAAETLEYAPDGSGVMLTNTMPYARARHELGRDGRSTQRPAHWREGIFQELREEAQAEYLRVVRLILRGGD